VHYIVHSIVHNVVHYIVHACEFAESECEFFEVRGVRGQHLWG